jgi:photosystem II stability/assembly factor-like uncharacterized protein
MKPISALLIFTALICSIPAFPQTTVWHRTTHTDLVGLIRIDDIYFLNSSVGFAACPDGTIRKTVDSGKSWTVQLTGGGSFRSIEFTDDWKYGVAGSLTLGRFYITGDSGNTWTNISATVPDTGVNKVRVCGLAHYKEKLYGVGWWGSTTARFYRSNDSGKSWTVQFLDTNLVEVTFTSADTCFASGARYYNGNKRQSVVLRSIDTGHTWTRVFADTTIGGRIWKLQFLDGKYGFGSVEPDFYKDTVCYISTDDGGTSWTLHHAGSAFTGSMIGTQAIGFINREKGWIGGYYEGYFETKDSGKTWQQKPYGLNFNRIFRIDSTWMYISGDGVYTYDSVVSNNITKKQAYVPSTHKLTKLYPNPANDLLTIEFDLSKQTNIVLEVANLDAKQIYKIEDNVLDKGHYRRTWNCKNMPAGNYMVWLGTDEIPLVQKFIIHR